MRKKLRIVALALALAAVLLGVERTLAFLVSSSQPVINTFTVGSITLELSETTGESYKLIPGVTLDKDPVLTVKAGSDACWLFFRAEASAELDRCAEYAFAEGWEALPEAENVYWRKVDKTEEDIVFRLLEEDEIRIKDTLTEEQMAALQSAPTLTFTGYAIQQAGIATAQEAWQQLMSQEVTGG